MKNKRKGVVEGGKRLFFQFGGLLAFLEMEGREGGTMMEFR